MSLSTRNTLMHAEMAEQPAVLHRLVQQRQQLADAVTALQPQPRGIAFLARGSSDNAALLGRYAVERATGRPTCLIAPSVTTALGGLPQGFEGWLVVAASQSGRTPEIVSLASRYAAAGASVIGITNDADTELATVADLPIALGAGAERAVPATKTVTAQMLVMLILAAALGGDTGAVDALAEVPAQVATALADPDVAERAVSVIGDADRLAVVGRGWCYPAALETALKLQETTGVLAHGFSAADFRHGPIAVCGPAAPALLLAGSTAADDDTRALGSPLTGRGARVAVIDVHPPQPTSAVSPAPHADAAAAAAQCLVATVRGQQTALLLCESRGIDPDAPAGLSKVTLTN